MFAGRTGLSRVRRVCRFDKLRINWIRKISDYGEPPRMGIGTLALRGSYLLVLSDGAGAMGTVKWAYK